MLTEGDDNNDPIADSARAILDGHIVLSRHYADTGIYPAVDIERSISRAMSQITTDEHRNIANAFKQVHAQYEQNRDLINIGAYQAGTDKQVDLAIKMHPHLLRFLSQGMHEKVTFETSYAQFSELYEAMTNEYQDQQQMEQVAE